MNYCTGDDIKVKQKSVKNVHQIKYLQYRRNIAAVWYCGIRSRYIVEIFFILKQYILFDRSLIVFWINLIKINLTLSFNYQQFNSISLPPLFSIKFFQFLLFSFHFSMFFFFWIIYSNYFDFFFLTFLVIRFSYFFNFQKLCVLFTKSI